MPLLTMGSAIILVLSWPDDGPGVSTAAEVATVVIEPAKAQRPISLRDLLIVGLEARLKSEVAFVDLVVLKVHTGKLPQRMVDETFFWARQRAGVDPRGQGRLRRPIIYFQPAMVARARRLNVTL
jgi:hypothetical protein